MQRTISKSSALALAAACTCVFLFSARGQDAEAAPAEDGAATPEGTVAAKPEKLFYPLLRCQRIDGGSVQVRKPRSQEWVPAEEGRFYPLGSEVRVSADDAGAISVKFAFGEKAVLTVTNAAVFATKEIAIGDKARTLVLKGGQLGLDLPRTLPDGVFTVSAPFFTCSNLAGESLFTYSAGGDGDEAVVRCVTGSMALEGRHYKVERMGAANQIRIRTTGDDLFTSLRGESGDCKVHLSQGLVQEKNFETGEVKDVPKALDFSLSPQCAIKIFRAKSTVGGRMVVSMMTFGPSGDMLNRCAFAEDRANVNSGELVVAVSLPDAEKEKAKASEADAEAVESVEAQPEASEKGADDGQKKDGEKKNGDDDGL